MATVKRYKPRPCPRCGVLTETTNSRARFCSDKCRKENERIYSEAYHFDRKVERNKNATEKRRANKLRAIEYLGGECVDCKQKWPLAVYDFHHLDPKQKDFQVSWLMNWNWGVQQKELDKCVLLCANCHRIRHHKEF